MLELPGLRGDDSLGFLAAIGLSALAEQEELPPLRLSWTTQATPVAIVEGADSVDELGAALHDAFQRLDARQAALPGVDRGFPLPKTGSGKDPMRMPPDAMARLFENAAEAWVQAGERWHARWLIALCAQVTTKKEGDVELSPFYAPSGQMAMRTSIFDKTMEAVEAVGGPADALLSWRRTVYDGANFDGRAKRDAAVTTSGKPDNRGAPSPTWLAAMGIRQFAMADNAAGVAAVGWQRVRLYPGYTSRSLVWPTWKPLLDPPAVRALLAHPALRIRRTQGRWSFSKPNDLVGLQVTGVYGASRRTLQQGDGPLGPSVRLWRPRES